MHEVNARLAQLSFGKGEYDKALKYMNVEMSMDKGKNQSIWFYLLVINQIMENDEMGSKCSHE